MTIEEQIRPIAIYLPQFHPIPENDEWWGKGFTEWRNVVKARPRFWNHYQPHYPADLGFYDLRLHEVREAQADLAKQYGIHGFCYYHYWFNGKQILNRPFQEVFDSGKPDFPFMLCWANENWTRVWDGTDKNILLKQEYSFEDDRAHIRALIPYFRDDRYIKVDGKPVFVIYKDSLFPDIARTLDVFREEAGNAGLDLYLCKFVRQVGTDNLNVNEIGFDAAIEFQPLSPAFLKFCHSKTFLQRNLNPRNLVNYLQRKALGRGPDNIVNYREFVEFDLQSLQPGYKCYPGVSPGWDNSSRRAGSSAIIFHESTPEAFKHWVQEKAYRFKPYSRDENFMFINAWNEWAEGCHLEPCEKWGHRYLMALQDGVTAALTMKNKVRGK